MRFSLLSRRPSGQAIPEFALVAPIFFILLFGIMQTGIVIYRYTTVGMAARETARYAMVHSPTSANPAGSASFPSVEQFAVNYAPFLSTSDVAVSYPSDPTVGNQSDALVTITHNYTQQIPFISAVPLKLKSSSQVVLSQ